MTDYWVVGKKSDQRELYVILNQKNANLIEVNGMSPPPGFMLLEVSLVSLMLLYLSPQQRRSRDFVRRSLTTFSSWTEATDRHSLSHHTKLCHHSWGS